MLAETAGMLAETALRRPEWNIKTYKSETRGQGQNGSLRASCKRAYPPGDARRKRAESANSCCNCHENAQDEHTNEEGDWGSYYFFMLNFVRMGWKST